MKRLRRTFVGLTLGTAIAASGIPSLMAAQTPESDADTMVRAELAAATLTLGDLPEGFAFVGETFLTVEQVAGDALDAGELTDAGFQTQYVSVYENRSTRLRVRSYVSAWTDEAAAEAGFAIVEDEARVNPDASLTDGGTTLGDEPREVTTGSYPGADGGSVSTVDVTFRRGNVLAGVALEHLGGGEVDAQTAEELGKRLDARVQQVQKGEAPANTDLELPGTVLSLQPLGDALQVGFLAPTEAERIYGLQGSVLDSLEASWVDAVAIAAGDTGATITIGVTTFGKPEDAASVVDHADELALPLTNQEAVDDVSVEGADAAKAFRFTSPGAQDGEVDSYRIIFAVDARVTVIDVQGASSVDVAADAANALAEAQQSCATGDTCTLPDLPEELAG